MTDDAMERVADGACDEAEEFDCLMTPAGWCDAAGSEACELDCPLRRMQLIFPNDPARLS